MNVAISGAASVSYDLASRITGISGAESKSYGYDALDRLSSVTAPGITQTYSYDPNGNRLTETLGAQTTSYSYTTSSNRLQSRTQGTTQNYYTYDPAGNLIADGTHTYTYDAHGRMVQATTSALTTSYRYNGLGQRVGKTAPGSTAISWRFVYDEAGHLIGEYDGSGAPIQETVYLGDLPIAVLSGTNTVRYVHADQVDTPRVVTDSQGVVVWRWASDPFGVGAPDQDPDGNGLGFVYDLRMAGQYFDAETGLHYNYFRDYDPSVGRYVQSDLIGLLGGLNTYIYAANSPATFRDQYGLLDADGHGLSRQIANGINGVLDGISEALKGLGMGSQAAPEFPLWEADGEQSHPDRIDEGVARNCPGDADCGTIGWSIDVLQRQLRFRRWDMQHHGGGDAGHIGFYATLRAELRQLIDLAKSKPCPYNPKADIEVTLPWNYPTPMF